MKLYYSPGASSQAAHIVLREAGLPFQLEKVNLKTKVTQSDADYLRINPKGYVPALQFDDGSVLTEVPAIVQWIGDEVPEAHLVPTPGTMERYKLIAWLNYIASEIHKNFSPLFNPATPEATREALTKLLGRRIAYVEQQLGEPYLTGGHFTVADAYLFTALSWARFVNIDLAACPRVCAWLDRVAARPKVQETLKAEGLLK